jgi:hypothetical protein
MSLPQIVAAADALRPRADQPGAGRAADRGGL